MATTSSSQAKSNSRPSRMVASDSFRSDLRVLISTLIKSYFSNTLGKLSPQGLPHVVNLVMALIYKESTFRPDAAGIQYNINAKGTEAHRFATSSAIRPFFQQSNQQRLNIEDSARAFGLMQVNGYYAIRGAFEGKGELLKLRPDIAEPLMINPGDSVRAKLLGVNNVDNQLLAGLIVLESKMKNAPALVRSGRYSNNLIATFGGYLGNGGRDGLGTTPEGYARSILEGEAYARANGSDPIIVASNKDGIASSKGPQKTIASGTSLSVAGCA